MKKIIYFLLSLLAFSFIIYLTISIPSSSYRNERESQKIRSTSSPKAGIEAKKERAEYFFNMLKDPATNKIPEGIRKKELEFAKKLNENSSLNKINTTEALNWVEAGPKDVGGRTRALAVDIKNSNTIIAGGVSGGIWKSTDKGATWSMKSTNTQILSVTSIAQDTRNGHTDTWYYASGEKLGSGQDMGYTAMFSGAGIHKSTDNCETWNLLPNAKDDNITAWSTPFDYVSKIIVNPTTGSVFIASHAFGILRSTDGGNSFALVLGGANEHIFSDIDIAENGTIAAVISSPFQGFNPANQPGVYKSTNDGDNWTRITPNSFPTDHFRSVVEIAPSNTNTAYVITFTGNFINDKYDDIRFHKININTGTAEDRSANMPNFGIDFEDYIKTQNNYNLVLAIKPDDENFVMIGATSFFRSTNGFSTKPTNQKLDWIGGYSYSNNAFMYPNFHPDIHSFAFDPTNANAMWWGHDGGLSYTGNISNTSYSEFFPWENKNNGYNVTQFYMVAIPDEAGDNRIMGGTQDNGTPSFKFDGSNISASYDVSSGDGAYAYFGNHYPYVSAQNGVVIRTAYDLSGNPVREYPNYSNITPKDAQNQLFVNPFVIDPNNEDIMIYPAGNTLWRNNKLNSLQNNPSFAEGISEGWTSISNAAPVGYIVSAISMSVNSPSSRLYYGAVDYSQSAGTPKVFKLDNAQTATNINDISINGLQNGMYIHNIAVNPNNGNEILVIISNYNVVGIYHSSNAGASYTAVEGNLVGNESNPGPSIRGASILPYNGTTRYIIATSTGVYSTTNLNGASTVWEQEGADVIGNVIVNYIASRPSDGRIVAGTHGRGAFVSDVSGGGSPKVTTNVQSLTLNSRPGETGSTTFTIGNEGSSTLNYNITVTGDLLVAKKSASNVTLKKPKLNRNLFDKTKRNAMAKFPKIIAAEKSSTLAKEQNLLGNDIWALDDGDQTADNFFGFGDGFTDLNWFNEFDVSGYNFQIDEIQFFLRTENALSNYLVVNLYDKDFNLLAEGEGDFPLSANGDFYSVVLDDPIDFVDGETFYIEIETFYSFINYPAGLDLDAKVPNKSFYFNGADWVNLNSISGAENGAFIIRAIGTVKMGGSNQDPIAVANVNPTQANINDMITFDGSGSYDNDGQITQYYWDFGDGATSTQQTVQHSYTQANTYNYSLTVKDNNGATNQTNGQVIIGSSTNQNPIAVANVNPTQANINDMITFDGSGSYDNDGQITQYYWNFGDGATSTQQTVQHSYTQANTYNYSLTVTDNGGATNQANGSVTISQSGSTKVTVVPSSGTISAGGSQLITITLDASTITAGTYVGQVNIVTNGGNISIPIGYMVDVRRENKIPNKFELSQNYPNPFNPSTTIEFAIPNSEEVSLTVYDMLGREVAELVNAKLSAGNYKVQFNAAENLSSGVYIYRLKTNSFLNTKKLLLIK